MKLTKLGLSQKPELKPQLWEKCQESLNGNECLNGNERTLSCMSNLKHNTYTGKELPSTKSP